MNRTGLLLLSALSLTTFAATAQATPQAPSHSVIAAKVAHHALVKKNSAKVSNTSSGHRVASNVASTDNNKTDAKATRWNTEADTWGLNSATKKNLEAIKDPKVKESTKLHLRLLATIYGEIVNSGKTLPPAAQSNYETQINEFMSVVSEGVADLAAKPTLTRKEISQFQAKLAKAARSIKSNSANKTVSATFLDFNATALDTVNLALKNPADAAVILSLFEKLVLRH